MLKKYYKKVDEKEFLNKPSMKTHQEKFDTCKNAFWDALNNDLNTSDACSQLFEVNRLIHDCQAGTSVLRELGTAIGLFGNLDQSHAIPQDIQQLALLNQVG